MDGRREGEEWQTMKSAVSAYKKTHETASVFSFFWVVTL